jgi:XTP/dITP diphosphohydrolase
MALSLEPGTKIVVATHNPGKVRELGLLLEGRFNLVSAGELNLPEPEETEVSFVGNALLKARLAADASGLIALSDDSGLSVSALGGAPGIYSARWAGPDKDFYEAMAKVESRMNDTDDKSTHAWFTCALAVAWPHGPAFVVEGQIVGNLTFPPRGLNGFGYDPIFVPKGHQMTFGEMDPKAKDDMSHRMRAFDQLKAALF